MQDPKTLKPCPWCASVNIERDEAQMFCVDCEAVGPRISFGEPRDHVERWNLRQASAATEIEHLQSQLNAATEALAKCRDMFRDYERQHEAKAQQIFDDGKTQGLLNAERMAMQARLTKAARNREMADMCDAALKTVGSMG